MKTLFFFFSLKEKEGEKFGQISIWRRIGGKRGGRGRNWWRTSAMEKAREGRRVERGWGIVDWMVTRCGKIATVGSHVPRIHVLPRTGTPFRARFREWASPSLPSLPSLSIDRQRAPFDTRLPRLMELRCRLMLCTFRSCFIGFRDTITRWSWRNRNCKGNIHVSWFYVIFFVKLFRYAI